VTLGYALLGALSVICGGLCIWLYRQTDKLQLQKHKLKLENEHLQKEASFYKEHMHAEFEKITNKAVKEGSETFSRQSDLLLQRLLDPLKNDIKSFRDKTESLHEAAGERFVALKTHIEQVQQLHNELSSTTNSLTRALTSDSKVRGDWGEVTLERTIEQIGLKKGSEYKTQVNLKGSAGRLRADAVVYLPRERAIVIDAKCNLEHWRRYTDATSNDLSSNNPDEARIHLDAHVGAMKDSIKDLSSKNYSEALSGHQLEVVFMFIPIEVALMVALQHEPELHQYAIEKQVALLGATNLYSMLYLVKQMWSVQYQSENANKIAQQGQKIYEKVVGLQKSTLEVGKHLDKARESWETGYKQMSEGRGNLLDQSKKLIDMGISSRKEIEHDKED
jgi:DNA recombination protein RmuC